MKRIVRTGLAALGIAYVIRFLLALPLAMTLPSENYFAEAARAEKVIEERSSTRNTIPQNQLRGYDKLTRSLETYKGEMRKRGNERNRSITEYLDESLFFRTGLLRHEEI